MRPQNANPQLLTTSRMTRMPPGTTQLGSRTCEVGRLLGRTRVTPGVVTEYDPGRVVVFGGNMEGLRVSGRREVEELTPGAARVTYRIAAEVRGPSRLLAAMIAAGMYWRLDRDLRPAGESPQDERSLNHGAVWLSPAKRD